MGCLKLTYYPLENALEKKGHTSKKGVLAYTYGFNGKERDPQGLGGGGSTYDYGFRIYNPNLGRFLSIDPLTNSFPDFSPFHYAGNNPVKFIDLDGLEKVDPGATNLFTSPALNMADAPASRTNAAGHPRNGPWFWRKMLNLHPEMFSSSNAATIRAGRAPMVDPTWISHNAAHAPYSGGKLVHHHVNQGQWATGIPERAHFDHFKELHPKLGGKNGGAMKGRSISRAGNLTSFFALATEATGFLRGNPHSFLTMLSPIEEGQLRYDIDSKQYYTPTSIDDKVNGDGSRTVTIKYSIYEDYVWDNDNKKYVGINIQGAWQETTVYGQDGSVVSQRNQKQLEQQ